MANVARRIQELIDEQGALARIGVVEEVNRFGVGGDAADDFKIGPAQVGGIVDDGGGFDALGFPIFDEELIDLFAGTKVLLSLADRSNAGLVAAFVGGGIDQACLSLGQDIVAVFDRELV